MLKSKRNGAVIVAAISAYGIGVVHADVNIRVRAGGGVGLYSVASNRSAGGRAVEYEADYVTVPVGATLIIDNEVYIDLVHQMSSGTAKFDWSPERPDFSRDDTTLTIGARKGDLSVYVGYKTSEANTDWPTGFQPDKLTTTGFIAGAGWAFPFSSSALTVGAGVGILSGTYDYLGTNAPDDPKKSDNPLQSETTIGFSLSAGYTYVFTPAFSVNADLKWQSYNYDFGDSYLEESPAYLTLNVAYTF